MAQITSVVVIADMVFTATAAIARPITGVLLMRDIEWILSDGSLGLSVGFYVFIGVFWLPVVVIQAKMRDKARIALTARFMQLYRVWFACGTPAFSAIIILLWLMLTRPPIAV